MPDPRFHPTGMMRCTRRPGSNGPEGPRPCGPKGGSMSENRSGAAVGFTMFAAFMMILIGSFHIIAGLAGILEDEFYVATPELGAAVRCDDLGLDPPARGHHRAAGRVLALLRRGLGSHGRRDHGDRQRDRELRVDPALPVLGAHDHRDRRLRDLGPDGPRSRHRRRRDKRRPTARPSLPTPGDLRSPGVRGRRRRRQPGDQGSRTSSATSRS